MTYSYPIQLNIQYSNNTEYRRSLRNVFSMNKVNFPDITLLELDDETMDEMMYDDTSANSAMDYIYNHTKENPDFIVLYEKAASFMFSTDFDIGLTILLGYDYLDLFHLLLQSFFSNDNNYQLSTTIEYIQLYNKLHQK